MGGGSTIFDKVVKNYYKKSSGEEMGVFSIVRYSAGNIKIRVSILKNFPKTYHKPAAYNPEISNFPEANLNIKDFLNKVYRLFLQKEIPQFLINLQTLFIKRTSFKLRNE